MTRDMWPPSAPAFSERYEMTCCSGASIELGMWTASMAASVGCSATQVPRAWAARERAPKPAPLQA